MEGFARDGTIISTREVLNELKRGSPNLAVDGWVEANKSIFMTPGVAELQFVRTILQTKTFSESIGQKQILAGTPVADPFVIAAAKNRGAIVVTEEKDKPNSPKIPTICKHFNIQCINLEQFMQSQGWNY